MSHRVIASGSRGAPYELQPAIRRRFSLLPSDTVVVHGAHRDGVDDMVDAEALWRGLAVERHPADWAKYTRPRGKNPAGMIRNEDMAKLGADLCVTWKLDGSASPGTTGMQKLAGRYAIPLEQRSVIGDIAAMKRNLYALFAVVVLGGTPACTPSSVAILAKVATVISETSSVLAIAEQAWQQYSLLNPPPPDQQVRFAALLEDCWRALNAGSAAVRGAQNLSQEQYDAAFADFRRAYGELHLFLVHRGVVGTPGTVGGGEQLPDPAVIGYRVEG